VVVFAYAGLGAGPALGGEVRQAEKKVPLGIMWGWLVALVLFTAVATALFHAAPWWAVVGLIKAGKTSYATAPGLIGLVAPSFAMGGPHGGGGLTEPRCASERGLAMGGGRPAERRFPVGGSGKPVARCHRTVLAYWKFESISLQQRVYERSVPERFLVTPADRRVDQEAVIRSFVPGMLTTPPRLNGRCPFT
jgi:hypothetical protein